MVHGDVAEEGDLLQDIPGHRRVGAAEDHVRLDADAQKLLGGVLGGLALELPGAGDGDDEGDVEEHDVVPPPLRGHLPDGLQEGLALDVPNGAADLHDGDVRLRHVQRVDAALDLPGDVGDGLDRAPEVVPPALPVEDVPVNFSGGDRGVDIQILVDEALIVAQVQVRLRAVVGDEDLPVLVGAHGAGVHVQVGVQLLDLHPQSPLLEQTAQRGGSDPLAQSGDHAACHEDVFHEHKSSSSRLAGASVNKVFSA